MYSHSLITQCTLVSHVVYVVMHYATRGYRIMPIEKTETYKTLCNASKTGASTGCRSAVVKVHYRQYNEVDRRVKPANLLSNMTAMPLQYKLLNRYGIWKRYAYKQYPLSYVRVVDSIGMPIAAWPVPHWETAIRNEISDVVAAQIGESVYEFRETVNALHKGATGLWNWYRCIKSFGTKCRWYRKAKGTAPRGEKLPKGSHYVNWDDASVGESAMDAVLGVDLATKLGIKPSADLAVELWERAQARFLLEDNLIKVSTNSVVSRPIVTSGWEYEVDSSYRPLVYMRVDNDTPVWTINAPLVLYEIIPVSFMLNWFWDLGSHLKSWVIPSGITFVGGCLTMKHRVKASYQRYTPSSTPPTVGSEWTQSTYYVPEVKHTAAYVSHQRVVLTGIPSPRILPPMPELRKVNNSIAKLFTAMEILALMKKDKIFRPRKP
jgi:hypothetical protein